MADKVPEFSNFLVIQTAFTGDAILASGLLEKLHHFFPEASVSILVRKGNEALYLDHPFLKEVLTWNKKEEKIRNLGRLLREVRKRKFDCVINCHRYASSGFIAGFSGAKHIAGYKQNPFSFLFNYSVRHIIGDGRHETERYNELISDFTGKDVFKPRLYPSAHDENSVLAERQKPYIVMAPGSVWFTKQMPEEKWIELCDATDPQTSIMLIGGPEDAELCSRISAGSRHSHIRNLAGRLSYLQSCVLIRDGKMNYVNDSAPLHMASAMNAPVTAFFCSTVPEFGFGPLSGNSKIIQVKGLPCKPCGLHGYRKCPLVHFKCGRELELPR
jgi:heptosyltransferase-2